ncbi:hypothetical protein DICVIV_08243 [Dictyocaulus viviparus]|uniref:Uncharacterized protein n=1 Tax=Dictyocaulus viviparus TaxID=29172 RepID=A0A0D8XPK3_DICVI|nr:hypothetical protein DICVIV_08243 [Dictyocaulus viviparus]
MNNSIITDFRPPLTTPKQRRKYRRENSQTQFVNALIFVLFVCVLILVMTIAFTLYFRFIRADEMPKQQKKLRQESLPLCEQSVHNKS